MDESKRTEFNKRINYENKVNIVIDESGLKNSMTN